MNSVTRAQVMQMAGTIVAGLMANPSSGNLQYDHYARQDLIKQTIQDTINAVMSAGLIIED